MWHDFLILSVDLMMYYMGNVNLFYYLFQYQQNKQPPRLPVLQKSSGTVHTTKRHTRYKWGGLFTKSAEFKKSVVRRKSLCQRWWVSYTFYITITSYLFLQHPHVIPPTLVIFVFLSQSNVFYSRVLKIPFINGNITITTFSILQINY